MSYCRDQLILSILETITVSESTEKKSAKLVKDDQIQELDGSYFVAGTKEGEIYQVDIDKIHGLVCRKTNADNPQDKGNLCMGWKNSHTPKICKHSYAVILYRKIQEEEI